MQSICIYNRSSRGKGDGRKTTHPGYSANRIAPAYSLFYWQQENDGRIGSLPRRQIKSAVYQMTEINIIPFSDNHMSDFRRINLEWLDHYNLTESHDLMVLDNPIGTILDRVGVIYLAESDGKIVGSAALMKEEEGVYELAKMAVTESFRGKGI